MWVLLMVFLACFQMGFYFVTTGWIFEIGLCENSINQSIKVYDAIELPNGGVFVCKIGGYRGVWSSIPCPRHLELRGIAAALGGGTLAAVRGYHVICVQVNNESRPSKKREGVCIVPPTGIIAIHPLLLFVWP